MKSVAFHNLGCKVNSYEMDVMQQIIQRLGFEIVQFEQKSDVYVVNTCTVTNIADRKSRQMLHRAKQKNPDGIVIAVGCYVETGKENLEKDLAVDLLVGNLHKNELGSIIIEALKERGLWSAEDENRLQEKLQENGMTEADGLETNYLTQTAEHTRAYIKVQDGCNQFCSYCLIPYARGRVRSRDKQEILQEIQGLVAAGYKEVVLTGIHISSYGIDFEDEAWKQGQCVKKQKASDPGIQDYSGETKLIDLLEEVCGIDGLERVRLGSLEPRIVTEKSARRMAALKNLCPHFHLSLQSGCDETLKRMNRHYTAQEYLTSVNYLRAAFENPAITTDVIVGFPGETEEEFEKTKAFLEEVRFYEMHIFKYSVRTGTRAEHLPNQIPEDVKGLRSDELLEMEARHSRAFREGLLNKKVEILLEEQKQIDGQEYWIGHTVDYVKVAVKGNHLQSGQIITVVTKRLLGDDIILGED